MQFVVGRKCPRTVTIPNDERCRVLLPDNTLAWKPAQNVEIDDVLLGKGIVTEKTAG